MRKNRGMKKSIIKRFFSFPTDTRDIFPWLMKHLFFWLGGWSLLGWAAIFLVALSFVGFMVGDFNGKGSATIVNGQIQLSAGAQAKNHAILKYDQQVADSWQKGLTQNQVQQVEAVHGGLPAAVLLAVGKVINGLSSPQPDKYYTYLKPKFTWKTVTETTTTYKMRYSSPSGSGKSSKNTLNSYLFHGSSAKGQVQFHEIRLPGLGGEIGPPPVSSIGSSKSSTQGKSSVSKSRNPDHGSKSTFTFGNGGNRVAIGKTTSVCTSSTSTKKVKLLTSITTWDGTIHIHYKKVETGTKGCTTAGKVNKYIVSYRKSSETQNIGDWSRVWNLFSHVPRSTGGYYQDTQQNQQFVAGLIGANDYTVMDPYVQQMVANVLDFNGGLGLPTNLHVGKASSSVIHNVLRWKPYIKKYAQQYHVPAVLIAGVMSQESGGRQHWASGGLKISSAGAVGLMQVEPSTAAGMYLNGRRIGSNAMADLANPAVNIQIGAMYLSELWHTFHNMGEVEAGYNAGGGREQEAINGYNAVTVQGVPVPAYTQTENYVADIQGKYVPALKPYFNNANNSPLQTNSTVQKA